MVKDAKDDSSRGFAFCEFADEEGLNNALKNLHGLKIGNRVINIRRTGDYMGNMV